ncbi:potassium transporter Kup [bacterium]|nr:potassium transporter Kup [bacterium]MCI0605197.1 potassium transporter Kup [bacterium]
MATEDRLQGRYLLVLCLGALGVVYGDIGTSPLYALRECFHGPHSIPVSQANVLGVLSLIFWSLIIVISIKYLIFVVRADNSGEGGILSLMSLLRTESLPRRTGLGFLVTIGLFGAALLYGDGIITPAISVLSAVEGLKVATPFFENKIIPITIGILFFLFFFQRKGTAGVGAIFGPLTLLWFFTIAILGIVHIFQRPQVLAAINPFYGVHFFLLNGWKGFLVLGSVFLVVTGGEALYADMGHFGKRPIRLNWFYIVLPALTLNYFGQSALLLNKPDTAVNPFFFMAPSWAIIPLVILATAATSIASQAVISGAYSLTRQAVQLGYSPRVQILHTSAKEIGQIYIPAVNWALMIATIILVHEFKTSSNLAAAYGVAVTTTMVITTILLYVVARDLWHWKRLPAILLMSFFLAIDLAFWGANIIKLPDGGWVPLAIATVVFTLMTTWWRGRKILGDRLQVSALPDELFVSSVEINPPVRVPGIAVYMDRTPEATPHALLHNIKHNKVLHEKVVLLTVETLELPHVDEKNRVVVIPKGNGIFRVIIRYGFMEDPNVPRVLEQVKVPGLEFKPSDTSYFLGRESLVASPKWGMAIWREKLFIWMSKNSTNAASFFRIPSNRVVELGAQVEL